VRDLKKGEYVELTNLYFHGDKKSSEFGARKLKTTLKRLGAVLESEVTTSTFPDLEHFHEAILSSPRIHVIWNGQYNKESFGFYRIPRQGCIFLTVESDFRHVDPEALEDYFLHLRFDIDLEKRAKKSKLLDRREFLTVDIKDGKKLERFLVSIGVKPEILASIEDYILSARQVRRRTKAKRR